MAPPRGSRSIVVGGTRFAWRVTERRSWIEHGGAWEIALRDRRMTLVVQHPTGRGLKLIAYVPVYGAPFRREEVTSPQRSGGTACHTPPHEVSVTPALVRRVIEAGLKGGWDPRGRGAALVLPEESLAPLPVGRARRSAD